MKNTGKRQHAWVCFCNVTKINPNNVWMSMIYGIFFLLIYTETFTSYMGDHTLFNMRKF